MYDQAFFEMIAEGCRRSAAVVVPEVLAHISPDRVVDVGCGQGWWGKAFEEHGCEVLGLDGEVPDQAIDAQVVDLEQPLPDNGSFDLAVCLEVAEHLTPGRAESFVADLTAQAPFVLFSAAIPGQGGVGHLNEQWPAYWVDLFAARGYACSGALRWEIWNDDEVENWYRQNLIVAARYPKVAPDLFESPMAPVFPVVHPVLYDARRS